MPASMSQRSPAVVGPRRVFGEQPRRCDLRRHVGELELDRLVLADRLAEGLAHLAVGDRLIERGLRKPDAARRDIDAPELEPAQRMLASPRPSSPPISRSAGMTIVLEHELGGVDALVAELFELAADREASPFLGDEQAHAAVARLRVGIGLDQQREALAVDAVGDPGLGAVDHVAVAVAPRDRADRLQIGAAIGLGQREAAAQLAGGEARQEGLLLRFGAEALHRRRHDEVRVEDAGQRHPHPRYALDDRA